MNLSLTNEEKAFVSEVRSFFAMEYPSELLAKIHEDGILTTREDHIQSQKAIQKRGWLGYSWPKEAGGPGWSPTKQFLFERELELAGAQPIIPMAITYIGPIIAAFGDARQKSTWLPDILESRALWAQGYSEPESGSDLASLRMTATRDGDHYILEGTKIWTTMGHWADWMFCLVRTSRETRKQDGLSLICVPMNTPGITVHPIVSIDGRHELNRIEFASVRTSAENLIGEEGHGWRYGNILLSAERVSYAHIGRKRGELKAIRTIATALPSDCGSAVLGEPGFLSRLTACEIETAALEILVLRVLTQGVSGATASTVKIASTQLAQKITEIWIELAGRYRGPIFERTRAGTSHSLPDAYRFAPSRTAIYMYDRAQTIYGGASEVQKNIIWRQLSQVAR